MDKDNSKYVPFTIASILILIWILVILLLIVFSVFDTPEAKEKRMEELYESGINVTITNEGWEEGIKVHNYIYPTNKDYVLNIPSSCGDMNCVGKNVTIGGTLTYNSYDKRNEMIVKWIIVNGKFRGWL